MKEVKIVKIDGAANDMSKHEEVLTELVNDGWEIVASGGGNAIGHHVSPTFIVVLVRSR